MLISSQGKLQAAHTLFYLSCCFLNSWMNSHEPKCTANFDKSFKAMEAQGAEDMWDRSIEKHSLQYVDFVGDGD